jgi:hypothetical protein
MTAYDSGWGRLKSSSSEQNSAAYYNTLIIARTRFLLPTQVVPYANNSFLFFTMLASQHLQ